MSEPSAAASAAAEVLASQKNKPDEADDPAVPETSATDDLSSSSSTDSDDDSNAGEEKDSPGTDGADALVKATLLKEEGNDHFKKGSWDEAARCYRRGTNRLKKVSGPDADPQVTALQLSLQTNLSMVLFKQSKFRASRDVASKALEVDPTNVKALYRRAVASRKMGDAEDAKKDLRAALVVDPSNAACKKELAAIKKQIDQANKEQKSALSKAFSSGSKSSFLYNDKEEEERRKEQERVAAEKKKQEEKAKRKKTWEDECVKRMARGDDAISFEDWEKEQDEAAKKKRKEEEAKAKAERKKAAAARKAAKAATKDEDSDDDDELTEQELASLRGYKKTKDGRTTSYFTRELSEEEKKRMGDMAPKKLDASMAAATPPLSADSSPTSGVSGSATSKWNSAGTWEEKDCTNWCQDKLKAKLQSATCDVSGLVAKITKVDELTGEGSVAMTGGKKRYIFDFHAKMTYEMNAGGESGKGIAKGVVRLPDICSTHYEDEELEVTFESWKKAPPAQSSELCIAARTQLAAALRNTVQTWVTEFNSQF